MNVFHFMSPTGLWKLIPSGSFPVMCAETLAIFKLGRTVASDSDFSLLLWECYSFPLWWAEFVPWEWELLKSKELQHPPSGGISSGFWPSRSRFHGSLYIAAATNHPSWQAERMIVSFFLQNVSAWFPDWLSYQTPAIFATLSGSKVHTYLMAMSCTEEQQNKFPSTAMFWNNALKCQKQG